MNIHDWWVPVVVLLLGIWDLGTGISRKIKAKKSGKKPKDLSSNSFIFLGILFIITGIWAFFA